MLRSSLEKAGKAIAVVAQQIIVAVAQETVFSNQAEVVGQLDGNTRFQSQFKARLIVPVFIL